MSEENIGGEEGIIEERRKKLEILRSKKKAYINDFHKDHYAADIHAEQGLKDYSVYTAAKAGLINFSKSLAKELAPDVLVNSVSPGAILWDINEPSEEKKNDILSSIPMKRIGNEKDIVSIINYLLTKNTYMTGRNINIDGGKSLG